MYLHFPPLHREIKEEAALAEMNVLKGFISIFTEMYFDGVSVVPPLPFETVGLLLVFDFCHILCSFT